MKSSISAYCLLFIAITASSTQAEVRVDNAWSRATPPGIERGAGYMTLHNTGDQARTLTGASAAWAQRIEIHESREVDGQMRMQTLPDGLTLQPGETLELAPMGRHLMLMGLAERLTQGDTLALTLEFRNGGTLNTQLDVRGPDGSTSQDSH